MSIGLFVVRFMNFFFFCVKKFVEGTSVCNIIFHLLSVLCFLFKWVGCWFSCYCYWWLLRFVIFIAVVCHFVSIIVYIFGTNFMKCCYKLNLHHVFRFIEYCIQPSLCPYNISGKTQWTISITTFHLLWCNFFVFF